MHSLRRERNRAGRANKLVDRYLGSMGLWLLGHFRKKNRIPAVPTRIGLFVINAIGDTILVSAIAKDIRQFLPDCEIILITNNTNRGVSSLIDSIDRNVVVPIFKPMETIKILQKERLDVILDFNPWARITAFYAALSNAFCIGFRTPGQPRHFAFDAVVDHSPACHEIENYRRLLAPLGIPAAAVPTIAISSAARVTVEKLGARSPYVLFHPWAGGANATYREWPGENWIALARKVTARGSAVIVTGGPADKTSAEALVDQAAGDGISIQHTCGVLGLAESAALAERADAVVAVNTGMMHLVACLDIPLIALHGPTNPLRWGPLSAQAVVLRTHSEPREFLHLGFEYPNNAAPWLDITVDEVDDALVAAVNASVAKI